MDESKKVSSEDLERLLQHHRRQEAVERLRWLAFPSPRTTPPTTAPVPPGGLALPARNRWAGPRRRDPPAALAVPAATALEPVGPPEDWLRRCRPQLQPLSGRRRRPQRRPPPPALVAARKGLARIVDALIYLALVLFILALGFLIYDNLIHTLLEPNGASAARTQGSPWLVQGWLSSPQETGPQAPLPFVAVSDTVSLRDPFVPEPTPAPGTAMPTRLVIPSIQLDTPVVEVSVVDGVWQTAAYAAGYHRGTARPGTVGNTVISGHKGLDGAVFARLEELKVGDEIFLQAGPRLYRYVVADKRSVWPQQVEVMAQTSRPILTLITCTAFDTQRLVVVANYDREYVTGTGNTP